MASMCKPLIINLSPLPLLLLFSLLFHSSIADVGTASHYQPPYLPTTCYGNDQSQVPLDGLFVAAGDGVWDNGASCGRQYLLRCLSSATREACVPGADSITVKVVDRASMLHTMPSKNATTLILSSIAFQKIATLSAASINIEYTTI